MSRATKRKTEWDRRVAFAIRDDVPSGPASGCSERALDDLSRGAKAAGMLVLVDGREVRVVTPESVGLCACGCGGPAGS